MKTFPKSIGLIFLTACFVLQVPTIAHHLSLILSQASQIETTALSGEIHRSQASAKEKKQLENDRPKSKATVDSNNTSPADSSAIEKVEFPLESNSKKGQKIRTEEKSEDTIKTSSAISSTSPSGRSTSVITFFELDDSQLPFEIQSIQAFYEYPENAPIRLEIYNPDNNQLIYSQDYELESYIEEPTELWLENSISLDTPRVAVELIFGNSDQLTFSNESDEVSETISLIEYLPNIELIFPAIYESQSQLSQAAVQILGERTI